MPLTCLETQTPIKHLKFSRNEVFNNKEALGATGAVATA